MLLSRFVAGILAAGLMGPGTGVVSAQNYPNKPIRIVTSPAGGGTDLVARWVQQGLSGLGQPVIVDNRPQILSAELASKAPPDGYTLLVAAGAVWIASLLQSVPYDPVRDFSPITLTTKSPNILVVHPSLPVKSVKDLIALAKAKPGELNFGSGGAGSSIHLAAELFKSMAGVNMVHVPFKGSAASLNALLGSHVQLIFGSTGLVAPHVTSGKLRALGVTSAQPSILAPGLPTVAASGLPGYEFESVDGVFAPSKTPAAIINRLNQELVRFLSTATVKEQLFNNGLEAVGSTPGEFGASVKSEMTWMGKLIKDLGLRTD